MIISGSLNVSKITQARLRPGKNGAQWLNFDIKIKQNPDGSFVLDKYDNHRFISEASTKEEREVRKFGTILGNVRVLGIQQKPAPTPASSNDDLPPDDQSPIPF